MTVHIIADSAADLPLSYYDEHNITLIPLRVLLGEQEFEDLITIEPKQVFDAMRQGASPKRHRLHQTRSRKPLFLPLKPIHLPSMSLFHQSFQVHTRQL